jgi:hypothetical protein
MAQPSQQMMRKEISREEDWLGAWPTPEWRRDAWQLHASEGGQRGVRATCKSNGPGPRRIRTHFRVKLVFSHKNICFESKMWADQSQKHTKSYNAQSCSSFDQSEARSHVQARWRWCQNGHPNRSHNYRFICEHTVHPRGGRVSVALSTCIGQCTISSRSCRRQPPLLPRMLRLL